MSLKERFIEMFDQDRNLPIEIPVYRIANEVMNEILKAIKFWNQHGTQKNTLYVTRAINDLSKPYGTTKSVPLNDTNVQNNNEITKIKNGIDSFKQYLLNKKTNATPEVIKLIDDLNETFYWAVESIS